MPRPVLRPESAPRRRPLDNGSVLLTRPLPEVHGVGVAVLIGTGTRDEDPARQGGISHLLEHMVFKGTTSRTAFELARDMEALGGQLDAYTTKEHTAYTLKVLPDQLEPALAILGDMLERSTFPEDQLALEKQVVIEEILAADDTPDDVVHERFCEHLWPDHPLRHPILGTQDSVSAISRDELVEHAGRVHVGGNVIVGAAGALGEREEELVAAAFGFPSGTSPRGPDRAAPVAPGSFAHVRAGLGLLFLRRKAWRS